MKFVIYGLLLLITACGHHPASQVAIPPGATVLILGDSLSYGTGANAGEDYPALLAQTTGWQVVNAGVPGDTSAGALARLPQLLEAHQPQLLIIELGGNDLLRQTKVASIEANLSAIITIAKKRNLPTVLIAIPKISAVAALFGQLSDHPLYATVAKTTGTPLIEEVFSTVLSKRDLKSDQIHPNAKGYQEVSRKLSVALQQLGFVARL